MGSSISGFIWRPLGEIIDHSYFEDRRMTDGGRLVKTKVTQRIDASKRLLRERQYANSCLATKLQLATHLNLSTYTKDAQKQPKDTHPCRPTQLLSP